MNVRLHTVGAAAVLWIWMLLFPGTAFGAAELEDGTYTADYLILKAENDSVSMANDYWEKPATVIIKNGKATVRVTINHSKWVTQFKVPGNGDYVDTKVIVTNQKDDKRLTEFTADISEPIISKIHVTVAEIDYDHDYTIRFVFDYDSFKLVKAADSETKPVPSAKPEETSKPAAEGTTATSEKPEKDAAASTSKPAESAKPQATQEVKETGAGRSEETQGNGQTSSGQVPEANSVASTKPPADSNGVSDTSGEEAKPVLAVTEDGGGNGGGDSTDGGNSTRDADVQSADGGSDSGGEAQQAYGQAGVSAGEPASDSETSAEMIAAVEDATASGESKGSSGFNWWSPVVALVLLLAGGVYIWRRKAQEVSK